MQPFIQGLQEHLWLFVGLSAVLGLLVGSFLNVVVYRLPIMLFSDWRGQAREVLELPTPEAEQNQPRFNLVVPNSACPHCQHEIKPWENIPLLSWMALGGKCSGCKSPISKRYPLVELLCGVLTGVVAWQVGFGISAMLLMLLTWGLLSMSLIDADHQILPDVMVLPLLWLGLIANSYGVFVTLQDAVYGAVFGYLSLWSVYWLFKLVTGKEGMGYGDFKLLALLGAWGGWQILPMVILLSSVVGAVLGIIILRLQKNSLQQAIPFGPYLAIAGWIALLWGESITAAYLSYSGF